jgi:hypothetical protein
LKGMSNEQNKTKLNYILVGRLCNPESPWVPILWFPTQVSINDVYWRPYQAQHTHERRRSEENRGSEGFEGIDFEEKMLDGLQQPVLQHCWVHYTTTMLHCTKHVLHMFTIVQ